MSRFPKLTETFILFEMLAVERHGVRVELFPLLRERAAVMHPEAAPFVDRAHYLPFLSPSILRTQLYFLRRAPRQYLGALAALVRHTWGSANLLIGGIGIFPKVAHAARTMQRLGVDHVHCHFATHPALAGFIVQRLVGIPFSFTAHGSDLHVDRHMLCEKIAEAAFVTTISDDNRRLMERECGGTAIESLYVIRCGVDTERIRPRPSRPAGGPLEIVSIGTLHEVKGQAHLIRACAILSGRGIPYRCRLAGDGPDGGALRALAARLGVADSVEFLGQRTRDEIIELFGESDVLVAPSVPTRSGKREGLPIVLMEAMSAGVTPVASDLSGIPELVEPERTGLLAPPGDAAAIAACLERLYRDPELRRRLAAAARAKVLDEYDIDRNAARLIARIREALPEAAAVLGARGR